MRSFNQICPLWCFCICLASRFLSSSGFVTAKVVADIEELDLSKPWSSTDSSPWTSHPKPNNSDSNLNPPTLNDGAMWAQGSSLILFGVALSNALGAPAVIPPQGTWRWNILRNEGTNLGFNGQPVQRTRLGAAAQSSTGEGYYLTGAITPRSEVRFNSIPGAQTYMVSGLVIVQEDTLSFSNVSTVGMNDYNTMLAGYGVLLGPLGKGGVLVSFGGMKNIVGAGMKFDPSGLVDPNLENTLDRISIYDIAAKTWYRQQATGDVPGWRYFGCSIVISAQDRSSHSIYIFGGWGNSESRSDGSVYVLSIPSFRWIRLTEDTKPRIKNTCHLLGKHTMLVVGGTTPTDASMFDPTASNCDGVGNFANGLGIFSLQNHTWNTAYDPSDDAPYELHPQITAIIGGSARGGATVRSPATGFDNTQLATFLGVTLSAAAPNNSAGISSQIPSTNPPPNNPPPNNPPPKISRKTLSAGFIAGIAVGAVIIATSVVLFWRWRRRASHSHPPNFSPDGSFMRLEDLPNRKTISLQGLWDRDSVAAQELSSRKSIPPPELPGNGLPRAGFRPSGMR